MPICRALSAQGIAIAPRTYWARRSRPPSRRALQDEALTEILAGIYEPGPDGRRPPECLYGSLKMWEHLRRQGIEVARCTVERLMRAHRWRGVTRGRTVRTTIPDPGHHRAPDLVERHFQAERPGQLHVADFTYVPLDGGGFGYTALVVDAFAGLIAGWECSLSKETAFVERAVRQATALRARQGHPLGGGAVHHSDAGSQYTSVRFAETLLLEGLTPSVGTVGDALDNALAETTVGLYKTECTRPAAVPRRAHPGPGGPGGDHQRLGALVQHGPADAPAGPQAPGRSRGGVLPAGQGRRVTAATPLRGPKSIGGGGFAAARPPGAPRRLRGRSSGLKDASRFLRKWPAATLDPGDLGGPWGRKSGQAQGLPRPGARRAGP